MDEWELFTQQHPKVAFNDQVRLRNKQHILFALECYPVSPQNYVSENIFAYAGLITWNKKLFTMYKDSTHVTLIHGFPIPYQRQLQNFTPYEDKYDAICFVGRHRDPIRIDGDIVGIRAELAKTLAQSQLLDVHCYGKIPYGGALYRGVIGEGVETFPGSLSKLAVLSRYKYTAALENCYHELHSWDYITEKIFDAFRAKTVPIYYGCYNIEDHIPPNLFIDYRQFSGGDDLAKYLKSLSKKTYRQMVEDAYVFSQQSTWGCLQELDTALISAVRQVSL